MTRRGPSGTEAAFDIWKRLRPSLLSLDIVLIDEDIETLATRADELESGDIDHDGLAACAAAAHRISSELTRLHKGLKEA